MSISRAGTKLSTKRTQDYSTVWQAVTAGTNPTAATSLASSGANLLFFGTDLPQAVSAVAGNAVVFSVAVTVVNSSAAVTYQWQTSTDGVTWANVSGTTSTYTRTISANDNNLRVRVLVTQLLRTVESGTCTISVVAAPESVFGAAGAASATLSALYLSYLCPNPPVDPMNVTRTYISAAFVQALCLDPATSLLGIPYIKISTANLNVMLSDPQ
jgi:hypothetical protein